MPEDNEHTYSVYHTFIIRAEKRDDLQKYLLQKGIETKIHYPIPIHQQPPYISSIEHPLPNTERFANQILSLPIHQYLQEEQIEYTVDMIESFYKE